MSSIQNRAVVQRRVLVGAAAGGLAILALLAGGLIPTTEQDFHLPGTQLGGIDGAIMTSDNCMGCHGPLPAGNDPYSTWSGSLMAQAGRDPLFEAQMVTANQDVTEAGYYCMRCHVPITFPSGHALPSDGSARDWADSDGVTCHFCHTMVDPVFVPGSSPPQDEAILAALEAVPQHYGNSMFVLDPIGIRRGTRPTDAAPHAVILSNFLESGDMCGTCHDVGNVCTTRQPDGTWRYNALDTPPDSTDPHQQFPLERTYTEWKLSAFANGGVDMGGRFGGAGATVVSSCQDCHMPKDEGQACVWGDTYPDLHRHDFAGASAWVLEIIGIKHAGEPGVDPEALAQGRAAAVSMLERAASLEVGQECGTLRVRVTNESGHKIPTGHIEGRRIWINVVLRGADGAHLGEYGHYDPVEAHLDEESTTVYEMHVGLSEFASSVTGYPAGETTHMALADIITKDNRIPPRGWNNATYTDGGAPAVACEYADGQHWSDVDFALSSGAVTAEVRLYYQTVTRHYIEALRDGNHTNNLGQELHDLWVQTDKCAPILMASKSVALSGFGTGDLDCDGSVGPADLAMLLAAWGASGAGDLDGDGSVGGGDLSLLLSSWD